MFSDADRALSPLLIFVIALGAGLRVAHFFTTGSFFYDEACVALNLVTRHPWQLLEPLAYNQAAAPGFLLLEQCLIHFFGTSELVFRLPALVSSIAVLILLAIFCEKLFNRWLAIVAVAVLAVSGLAIFSASELKPYSMDAALTLWMMLRFHFVSLDPTAKKQWILFLVSGVIALLLSQAIIFVLLSLGLLLAVVKFREMRSAVRAGLVVVTWLGLFSFLYFSIYHFEGNAFYIKAFWSDQILSVLKPHFAGRAGEALRSLLPWSLDSLSYLHEGGLIFISAVGLYFTAKRAGVIWAAALTLPYVAVILASALGLFPIAPRLLLFVIPLLVVLVAAGFESLLAMKLRSPLYRFCLAVAVSFIIGSGTLHVYAWRQKHFPRLYKSLISQSRTASNCAAVYVPVFSIPVWEFYTRDAGMEGVPSAETYQRVLEQDCKRAFAEDPEPPLPQSLRVYHYGCKPLILGELPMHDFSGHVSRQTWARSELTRMRDSGASSAYVFDELDPGDELQALLDEAGNMGANVQKLGGGHPYLGYLGKIDFASSGNVLSPRPPGP